MKDFLSRVRHIEIRVRRLVSSTFAGAFRSAFRGSGLEFDEVRAYQYGDDVRSIDWNVSAKHAVGDLFVKVFREERELNVFMLLDLSASLDFGGGDTRKMQVATEIAAILAYSAQNNNDRFGLAAFTDQIELYYRPTKGRRRVLGIISRILAHAQPGVLRGKGTNLRMALEFFRRLHKRRSILFVISDFLAPDFERTLVMLHRHHEVNLIRIVHPEEQLRANLGIVPVVDAESGTLRWLFSSNASNKSSLTAQFADVDERLGFLARRYGVGYLTIDVTKDYVAPLEQFFRSRNPQHRRAHA